MTEPIMTLNALLDELTSEARQAGATDAWDQHAMVGVAEAREKILALVAALREDAARIDALEGAVLEEPILLHASDKPVRGGYRGLGLKLPASSRTLREAIDNYRGRSAPPLTGTPE